MWVCFLLLLAPSILSGMAFPLALRLALDGAAELTTQNSELRTPNSELTTPNSQLRTPNSDLTQPTGRGMMGYREQTRRQTG